MELSDYELIRYPSGQLVITRAARGASGPRDVIGAYTSEQEAQSVLHRLAGPAAQRSADAPSTTQRS